MSTRSARDDDSAHIKAISRLGCNSSHVGAPLPCRRTDSLASPVSHLSPSAVSVKASSSGGDGHQQRDVTTMSTTASYTANGARRPAVHTTTAPGHRLRLRAHACIYPALSCAPPSKPAEDRCARALQGTHRLPQNLVWKITPNPHRLDLCSMVSLRVTCGEVNHATDFYLSAR